MGMVSGKWACLAIFRARFARVTVLEPPLLEILDPPLNRRLGLDRAYSYFMFKFSHEN